MQIDVKSEYELEREAGGDWKVRVQKPMLKMNESIQSVPINIRYSLTGGPKSHEERYDNRSFSWKSSHCTL